MAPTARTRESECRRSSGRRRRRWCGSRLGSGLALGAELRPPAARACTATAQLERRLGEQRLALEHLFCSQCARAMAAVSEPMLRVSRRLPIGGPPACPTARPLAAPCPAASALPRRAGAGPVEWARTTSPRRSRVLGGVASSPIWFAGMLRSSVPPRAVPRAGGLPPHPHLAAPTPPSPPPSIVRRVAAAGLLWRPGAPRAVRRCSARRGVSSMHRPPQLRQCPFEPPPARIPAGRDADGSRRACLLGVPPRSVADVGVARRSWRGTGSRGSPRG